MAHQVRKVCGRVIGLLVLAVAVGGCTGPKYPELSAADFDRQVLQAERPVLVAFYKQSCPTCGLAEDTLNQLQEEYRDRVSFYRFLAMTAAFQKPSPEIYKRYELEVFPTVVLFAAGQERCRWINDYSLADYRKGLDAVVARPAAATGAGTSR